MSSSMTNTSVTFLFKVHRSLISAISLYANRVSEMKTENKYIVLSHIASFIDCILMFMMQMHVPEKSFISGASFICSSFLLVSGQARNEDNLRHLFNFKYLTYENNDIIMNSSEISQGINTSANNKLLDN